MRVEIISTGTELLLGEIRNTNFQYLANKLNNIGFNVLYETTVGDNYDRMKNCINVALNRVDIVITSGGLGPTQGDITKEVTADVLNLNLIMNEECRSELEKYFNERNTTMTENNLKQAVLPEGAMPIKNTRGTAPGVFIEQNGKVIINLPGPPNELINMFETQVISMLLKKYGEQGIIYSQTLRCIGMGESTVADKLYTLIKEQDNPTIAIYARNSEILIRVTAKANNLEVAKKLTQQIAEQIKLKIPTIFTMNDENIEEVLGKELLKQNLTISCAESCTGGLLSSFLTDISGSSQYLLGSVISYSNEAKVDLIQVDKEKINTLGAVSAEVAKEMSEGVAKLFSTDIGVGITGIAGPLGGSLEKPVGTVYISISYKGKNYIFKNLFGRTRKEIKLRTVKTALFNILQIIRGN